MLMIGLYNRAPSSGGTLILDVTPFVQSATMSTDVHGYEALEFTVLCPLVEAFSLYNQAAVVYVGVLDGATIVWEGRLEDPTLNAGASSGFRGQALGYWRAFTDTPYTALWSTTSLTEWQSIIQTQLTTAYPDRYEFNTANQLYIAARKNQVFGNTTVNKAGYLYYQTPSNSSRNIVGAQFSFAHTTPAANWQASFQLRNPDFSGISNPWLITSAGAGTVVGAVHITFTGVTLVDFLHWYATADAAYAGETDACFLRITNLRLVTSTTNRVNTTLTVARTNGAGVTCTVGSTARMYVGMQLVIGSGGANSEMITVTAITGSTTFTATVVNAPGGGYIIGTTVQGFIIYADEIASDLLSTVTTLNSNQLSTSTAQIQSPGLDLLDEVYQDQLPSDILAYLASRGDASQRLWEVGVGKGQVLYLRPQRTANRAWYVDVTDLSLARTLDRLYNSAYGRYVDPSNRPLRTASSSDAASVARYALTRRAAAPASTTNATLAATQRDAFIANNDDPLPRATISFDAVYDAAGSRWPLYLVRAGDTITVRNVPPSVSSSYDRVRTFMVTHTQYNLMSGKLAVEPEVAPPTIQSLIAQQQNPVLSFRVVRGTSFLEIPD